MRRQYGEFLAEDILDPEGWLKQVKSGRSGSSESLAFKAGRSGWRRCQSVQPFSCRDDVLAQPYKGGFRGENMVHNAWSMPISRADHDTKPRKGAGTTATGASQIHLYACPPALVSCCSSRPSRHQLDMVDVAIGLKECSASWDASSSAAPHLASLGRSVM